MPELVRDVVIVGGGTAGWLTALHLKTGLGPQARVRLIESPDVPTIGVGEGTQPTLRVQMGNLNISEDECLRQCDGSFKNGVRFVGWCGGDGPREYLHPFFSGPAGESNSPIVRYNLWLEQLRRGRVAVDSLAESCFAEAHLMRQRRAPIGFQNGQRMQKPVANYAYHIDAAKLGIYLRTLATSRGVEHVSDHVESVRRGEDGRIAELRTRSQGAVSGEFYIDCTGFRRKLIGQFSEQFVDYSPYLFNDRALTARLPYEEAPATIESSTISTALRHGWVWQVPLQTRLGVGYVYSSRFVIDADAARELAEFLGFEPRETQLVRFRTGHHPVQWAENCVSIGLSGGFIEPLEATGVALITYAIFRLMELWPTIDFPPPLSRRFNQTLERSYEWVRDFIVMHYCFNQRDDSPYWVAARQPEAIPDSVREQMELFDQTWPFGDLLQPQDGFRLPGALLACVLAGFRRLPRGPNAYVAGLTDGALDLMWSPIERQARATATICPDHAAYLRSLLAAPPGQ